MGASYTKRTVTKTVDIPTEVRVQRFEVKIPVDSDLYSLFKAIKSNIPSGSRFVEAYVNDGFTILVYDYQQRII